MNLIIILSVVVAVVVVVFGVDRIATHRNLSRREELKQWETWSPTEQARRVRNMSLDHGDEISRLRRSFLIYTIATAAVGCWALVTIQDTADTAQHAVEQTCQSTTNLLRAQSADLTDQIRQRQVRRDNTADEIIRLQQVVAARPNEPTLEDVTGFEDLPESVQAYASAIAVASATQTRANDQANIADARRRLTIYDEDLERLRAQVDDIRKLVIENNKICPATA